MMMNYPKTPISYGKTAAKQNIESLGKDGKVILPKIKVDESKSN
jgi:hypothetical protein